MSDDRHEGYRQLFTRQYIQEVIGNIDNKQELADIFYDVIEIALHKEYKQPYPTVKSVLEEALELKNRTI